MGCMIDCLLSKELIWWISVQTKQKNMAKNPQRLSFWKHNARYCHQFRNNQFTPCGSLNRHFQEKVLIEFGLCENFKKDQQLKCFRVHQWKIACVNCLCYDSRVKNYMIFEWSCHEKHVYHNWNSRELRVIIGESQR